MSDNLNIPIKNYNNNNTPIREKELDTKKYKTCDGKDVATMEEVMQYNQMYYERMKIRTEDHTILNKIDDYTITNKGRHR